MAFQAMPFPRQRRVHLFGALLLAMVVGFSTLSVDGQPAKIDVLRIGTSGSLAREGNSRNEKSSTDTLRSFIKEETSLESEIIREKSWNDLAEKMSKGQLQIGVFQGYEYSRAQEKYPDLKPLAVAVNVYVYPVVYLVTGRDNKATDFAGLQGQSLATVANGPDYLGLSIDQQCSVAGKKPDAFFSKIVTRDNFEDIIDDVVDGVSSAAVADRAALDAYKRRKPGRFKLLKPIAQSKPFPPAVVAHYGNTLDEATLKQFRDGLLNASNKEKGQTMLTLFRLTGFQEPPADFATILTAARTTYTPIEAGNEKPK
jgi:ABC-type phosphate/phosphonate transport system substrate-binding protein